ncbi:MAG TPA: tetratricopeptide repeat protein, partial [Terriglobales bacterium]|nr:tetratricopeptide repeat protein [Terriglobales bacterium]
LQLDPVSPFMAAGTARVLYLMRRYDEAIDQYKKTLDLDPQFIYAHLGLGTVYIQQKRYPEAVQELQLAGQLSGNNLSSLSELARAYPPIGKSQEARNILSGFLRQAASGSFPPKPIAKVYLALGDKSKAITWLGAAIQAQDISLELESDPIWDPLRSDPRFESLMRDERQPANP